MKKAAALLLTAAVMLGLCGCGRIDSKKVDDLIDEGYVIEQVDDDSICIFEDGIEYHYKTGLITPALDKVVFTVSADDEHSDWCDRTIIIRHDGRLIVVLAEKYYTYINRDGEEVQRRDVFCFKFKRGQSFGEEGLYNNRGFADIAGDYRTFIQVYLTPDELQEIYDRAMELRKEI